MSQALHYNYPGMSQRGICFIVSCGEKTRKITLKPSENPIKIEAITLPVGDEYAVKVEALKGEVILSEIEFRR